MNSPGDAPETSAAEFPALERLSRWLVEHAARAAPAALAQRLEEEWLAHLAAQRSLASRLRFALGCCWARRVIAQDYLASAGAATGSATPYGAIVLGQHDAAYFSRRTTILLLIVRLHAIVIYGFMSGFRQRVVEHAPGPMHWSIVNPKPTPHIVPPPPTDWRFRPTKPIVSETVPPIEFPPDAIDQRLIPPLLPPSRTPAVSAVNRILGGPGTGFPNTADFYPFISIRLREMGVATVRVCIDERGELASAPMITRSSGSARLDRAALQLAKAGSGHYRSTTEDGRSVADCYPFRIRFQLKE